jgi:hypothetical protein
MVQRSRPIVFATTVKLHHARSRFAVPQDDVDPSERSFPPPRRRLTKIAMLPPDTFVTIAAPEDDENAHDVAAREWLTPRVRLERRADGSLFVVGGASSMVSDSAAPCCRGWCNSVLPHQRFPQSPPFFILRNQFTRLPATRRQM